MVAQAEFIGSFTTWKALPADSLPHFAFTGRSNVGKSSLINLLSGRRGLAKVSGTPGKTQLINLFRIDESWLMVDLPGYGYARQSRRDRSSWLKMIREYLLHAPQLKMSFVLIDSNIPPQKIDLEFINWLGEHQVPFQIVFTKSDRITRRKLRENISLFRETMELTWEVLPDMFQVSSVTKEGSEELLHHIREMKNR